MIQGEPPSVSVGLHRCFTRSFRRLECLWLFDFKPGHEPVELLPGQLFYFQLISGPAESALDLHTFIQQHKSVRFPEQSFDPVTTFSTEKIQGTSPWIHMELILYNSAQPVPLCIHLLYCHLSAVTLTFQFSPANNPLSKSLFCSICQIVNEHCHRSSPFPSIATV